MSPNEKPDAQHVDADRRDAERVPNTIAEAQRAMALGIEKSLHSRNEGDDSFLPDDEEISEDIAAALQEMITAFGGNAENITVTVEQETGRVAQASAGEGESYYAVYADKKFIATIIFDGDKMNVASQDWPVSPQRLEESQSWLVERVPRLREKIVPQDQVQADIEVRQTLAAEHAKRDADEAEIIRDAIKTSTDPVEPAIEPEQVPQIPANDAPSRTLFQKISGWFRGEK